MKRWGMQRWGKAAAVSAVTGAVLLASPGVGTAGAAGAAGSATSTRSAACTTPWGSLAERAGGLSRDPLTNIRSGRHACFDRLVFDLRGRSTGYRISYVRHVHAQGSGSVVPVRGAADLQVDLLHPAYDRNGRATYHFRDRRELVPVGGYRTLRQVAWGGSFEGHTTVAVGVRARLPFRSFVLRDTTGSRLVLDVAHRW